MTLRAEYRMRCENMCNVVGAQSYTSELIAREMATYDGWGIQKTYEDGSGGGDICPLCVVEDLVMFWLDFFTGYTVEHFGCAFLVLPNEMSRHDVAMARPDLVMTDYHGLLTSGYHKQRVLNAVEKAFSF